MNEEQLQQLFEELTRKANQAAETSRKRFEEGRDNMGEYYEGRLAGFLEARRLLTIGGEK